ncbi:MAG: AEC family transporter [Clostridia bacterium]|nr:AEC family transporter [Clostridia bacterium]
MTVDLSGFFTMIAALFLMLALGYFAGKIGIINSVASKNLSRLIIHFGQPALIVYSLVRMEYTEEYLMLGFGILGFGLILHFVLAGIAFLAFLRFRDFDERKITEFAAVFGNVGFIGIPILESLFGALGAFMGAFFVVSFNLLLWSLGLSILARQRSDIRLTPKKIFLNLGTIPSAIGIVLFLAKGLLLTRLPAGAVQILDVCSPAVMQALSFVASLCAPVSTLIIGALLATRTWKQILGSGKVYYLCFVKLLVLPVLVVTVMWLLGFNETWLLFAAAVTAMPSATVISMLAELYDISPGYSAQAVGTTSLISLATMPIIIAFAQFLTKL